MICLNQKYIVTHIIISDAIKTIYELVSLPRSMTVLAAPMMNTNKVIAIANGNLLDSGT
jgi:hypothetical protein